MLKQRLISIEHAKELQKNWIEHQGKYIGKEEGHKDCREFVFKIDELREYLDYVEKCSEEQGIKNPGIRIYFGAYQKSEEKSGTATLFLAPTKPLGSQKEGNYKEENNYEIAPFNTIKGGWPPLNY